MELFDILHKNALSYPDRTVFEDERYGNFSFADIDSATSKVYSYLTDKGITTDKIVVIKMNRSTRVYLTMLGVWRAGAAFTVIGEYSTDKYVKQVISDAENGFLFDDGNYEEAMNYPEKPGYKTVSPHDIACVVYSTGSTGFFKGSVHEYGNIKNIMNKLEAVAEKPLYEAEKKQTRNVIFYPLGTINCIMELLFAVYFGYYYYIVPYDTIIKSSRFVKLLNDKKIEIIAVSSNNYRKLKEYDLPYIKRLDLSFDVNIGELDKNYDYTNTYALTEAFGWVTSGYMEKKQYDVVPAGKVCPLTSVKICDKNGNEVPKGKIGEICVFNEFFRGYIKRPDLTSEILHNGWISTGDVGYFDCYDSLTVLGRKLDIIETDKGYIIPTLISVQIKKHFPDIANNYVKLFKGENTIKICVYYCGSKEHTKDEFVSVLRGKLPEYMMPTHCIKEDDFKYIGYGKIDRLSFKEPD